MRAPKPKLPFKPDCIVKVLGDTIPARFICRLKEPMDYAWIQTENEGVCTVNVRDLYKLEAS